MRLKHQWWSVLVAVVLAGLVGVTAAAAAGEQFLPVLSTRDGGINGVKLIWEECETVYDVDRGVEYYERLKGKGPTGAAAKYAQEKGITPRTCA